MKELNIKDKPHRFISTDDALKDVIPIDWNFDDCTCTSAIGYGRQWGQSSKYMRSFLEMLYDHQYVKFIPESFDIFEQGHRLCILRRPRFLDRSITEDVEKIPKLNYNIKDFSDITYVTHQYRIKLYCMIWDKLYSNTKIEEFSPYIDFDMASDVYVHHTIYGECEIRRRRLIK